LKKSNTGKNIRDSGLVSSKQNGVHPHLDSCVIKHLEKPWMQPLHFPTVEVFRELEHEGLFSAGQSIILDSGCGTGQSSQRIAESFPDHLVIGVDRSFKRLTKSGVTANYLRRNNCLLVRAELETFWRLMHSSGTRPDRHFLLYPNPWPKAGHLSRRWHGHPVFPTLLALGGNIELRCNWGVYAKEFAQAVSLVSKTEINVTIIQPEDGISPFEQKYLERGQTLYSVCVSEQCLQTFRSARPAV
jgi:tRNA (guanine-N7-)-methyltransferase